MKSYKTIFYVTLVLMINLLIFPNICLEAAEKGLLLWYKKVIPSLLPFMILIHILLSLNLSSILNTTSNTQSNSYFKQTLFPFIIGLVAGYPMGSKVVTNLYTTHQFTKPQAELALCFCNNCGPLFIIGTVGTSMLHSPSIGYFLLFIHIFSAFLMNITYCSHLSISTKTTSLDTTKNTNKSFPNILNDSVIESMDTCLCIGGYIILFSVISAILTQTPIIHSFVSSILGHSVNLSVLTALISSILELSNGTFTLSKLTLSPTVLALISATISFGGICTYFQTLYIVRNTNLSTKPYIISKALQSILSFSLTYLLLPIYNLYTPSTNYILTGFHLLVGILLIVIWYILCSTLIYYVCRHYSIPNFFHIRKPSNKTI